MAELILTEEERKATWAEADEVAMGKATKWVAFQLGLTDSGHPAPSVLMAATTVLINLAAKSNADRMEQTITNAMRKGVAIGDWMVIVKQTKKPHKEATE